MKCEADIQKMYDDAKRELGVLREQFRCEPVPFVREMIVSKQAYVYALEQVLNIESEARNGSA